MDCFFSSPSSRISIQCWREWATGTPACRKTSPILVRERLLDTDFVCEEWELLPIDGVARFQNGLALQTLRPAVNEARLPLGKIARLRAGEVNSGNSASATVRAECIIEHETGAAGALP